MMLKIAAITCCLAAASADCSAGGTPQKPGSYQQGESVADIAIKGLGLGSTAGMVRLGQHLYTNADAVTKILTSSGEEAVSIGSRAWALAKDARMLEIGTGVGVGAVVLMTGIDVIYNYHAMAMEYQQAMSDAEFLVRPYKDLVSAVALTPANWEGLSDDEIDYHFCTLKGKIRILVGAIRTAIDSARQQWMDCHCVLWVFCPKCVDETVITHEQDMRDQLDDMQNQLDSVEHCKSHCPPNELETFRQTMTTDLHALCQDMNVVYCGLGDGAYCASLKCKGPSDAAAAVTLAEPTPAPSTCDRSPVTGADNVVSLGTCATGALNDAAIKLDGIAKWSTWRLYCVFTLLVASATMLTLHFSDRNFAAKIWHRLSGWGSTSDAYQQGLLEDGTQYLNSEDLPTEDFQQRLWFNRHLFFFSFVALGSAFVAGFLCCELQQSTELSQTLHSASDYVDDFIIDDLKNINDDATLNWEQLSTLANHILHSYVSLAAGTR